MNEPLWLNKHTISVFHDIQIQDHGGSYGIRDENLLESAMGRPQNIYAYDQGDIFDMAAAYTYGIAKNHPFIDGNKRTAFLAAYTFLNINGYLFQAPEAQAVTMTVSLANGEIEEKIYVQWLRDNTVKK